MAIIHPFKAWRPSARDVREVACVPYDVINSREARVLASGKPKSFLHVIRPEIDLPKDISPYDDRVYKQGAENLQRLIQNDILKQESSRSVYIYRLEWKGSSQTGLFTCVSVEDYDNEVILKHELTRPAKEDDRTRHILTQSAHAEPVMMTYRGRESIDRLVEQTVSENDPVFDFEAEDGVHHILWRTDESTDYVSAFEEVDNLYIADGHHRCKSASRAAQAKKENNSNHTGNEEYNYFPAVLFPMSQMNILPYNRVVHSVPDNFIQTLNQNFDLREDAGPEADEKGTVSIYHGGRWYAMALPVEDNPNSVQKLDAHRLQKFVLEPILGIKDIRRDENISFVGGIRGTEELENSVDSGEAEAAFSMYPTTVRELVEVSDEGLLMPPKSTWFEPKLRSGLLVHTF